MLIKQSQYETLLAEYSNRPSAIALLRQYRPYLEMLPSLRRPDESVITIPLPLLRLRTAKSADGSFSHPKAVQLPCDIAILTCDPEWKIKMGVEIMVFIHRPQEHFSELLRRWRQTEVWLNQEYEWMMPLGKEHIFSEGAQKAYPLFVGFTETSEQIRRGLKGAGLPLLIQAVAEDTEPDQEVPLQVET
ncbi:MAG: hypothetical protein GVY17_09720 [Cyanobacteria bacterium]|jgi:hypothetical protein|nr:hypothetical protein [Cyanobacteria bacterium GSL.Bin21]